MDEKDSVKIEGHQASKPASAPQVYDSNPFTAAWSGVQKLARTNGSTVIGVALFNILLFALTGITAVLVILAIGAFAFKRVPELLATVSDPAILDFLDSINDTSIYATWGLGLVACIFFMSLTQSLQLNLTVAAARSVSLKFGALLKASIRSVPPILGLIALTILGILTTFLVIGLLSTVLGIITFLIGVLAVVAIIYVGIRLSYASYSIVDLHLSPIAAIKHSWRISSGHIIETIGSAAVASLVIAVPSLILSALARVTEGAPTVSGMFSLLEVVLTIVLVIGAAMSVAERYAQLQAVETKQLTATNLSPLNYVAILLFIVLAPILDALSPKLETQSPLFPTQYETIQPTTTELDDSSIYRIN
jgi:hypothetical protein